MRIPTPDNKLGQPADVLGAGGLLHTLEQNVNGNLGYDVTPTVHATYLFGYWNNDERSRVQSYPSGTNGAPTFAKTTGFATNNSQLDEEHLMHAVALKTDGGGVWDGDAVVTHYDYLRDRHARFLSESGGRVGIGFSFSIRAFAIVSMKR